jgi:hypothetical protein
MVTERARIRRREYMRAYRAQDLDAHEITRQVSAASGVLGGRWSDYEDQYLAHMIRHRFTEQQMADKLLRSKAGVAARRRRLGWTGANVPPPEEGK